MYEYTNKTSGRCEKTRGFTLVELMVAMSVFIVAMTISVGIFIQGLRSQRQLVSAMAVSSEMSLVLEGMMRQLRTGYEFVGDLDSSQGTRADGAFEAFDSIAFEGVRGSVVYTFDSETITQSTNGAPAVTLTGTGVKVRSLSFILPVRGPGDFCDPWRVTIAMEIGVAGSSRVSNIQTTVSSRVLPADLDSDKDGDDENDYKECVKVFSGV